MQQFEKVGAIWFGIFVPNKLATRLLKSEPQLPHNVSKPQWV